MNLVDQKARDTIRHELDETLVVEAAAGTGKTTALVHRIIEVIRSGRGELANLVAVTFTEKAAGELKLRLRGVLERARAEQREGGHAEVSRRLERGLSQLEEAHIGTIHGFCADLLKERPLQAGVDPLFEVATEEETERVYRRVFDRWLEETLADPPPGVRRLLRRQAFREKGPVDDLYRAGLTLLDIRDFPTPWQIRPFDRESEIDDLVERLSALADASDGASNPRDYLFLDLEDVRGFVRDTKGQEILREKRDYDALEHGLAALRLGFRKGRGRYKEGVAREDLIAEREALRGAIGEFKKRAGADLAAHLQNELVELVERYQVLKEKRGRLDFLDLLSRTRDLLRGHDALRRELQARFTHIFVDEFQDTDPLQAEILLLLSADAGDERDWRRVRPVPGKLFIVADPKQSIYRFRRADVALYQRIKKQLVAAGAKSVYLTVSFRSVPDIQELVNVAMSQAMKSTPENHQAEYVPLDVFRPPLEGQPSIVALPVPRPYGDWGRVTQYAIERSEPTAVAAWVRWLVEESGWKVLSRGDREPRPVSSSDVCLLFRRFRTARKVITQPYVEALQGFDIPHVLVGGRGFHQREEVEAMRVALTAIERPDDELSVFSTLRGPLFSLPDESLFLFRNRQGSLHPFRETGSKLAGDDASVVDALDVLARLHKARNHRPIAFTIRELLDASRAQAGFALWQAGDQVLANVLRLMQLARNFEETGGLSFRGFVTRLDALAEDENQFEGPLIEDGVEGVRLMTVHKAKGLEFPVVVLCDITCASSLGASRHVDPDRKLFAVRFAGGAPWELLDHEHQESERDAAESLRLLYVAATRARDVLAIPVVADQPHERGWTGPLLPAIYPSPRTARLPSVPPPSCPRFSADECVVDRPGRAPVPPGQGIRPGLHKPARGAHGVVWWDPALFEEMAETKPGLRRYWILQSGESEGESSGGRAYDRWSANRVRLVESGARPRFDVTTVTKLVDTESPRVEGFDAVEMLEVTGRDPQRPSGKRFGALVHELLARCPLEADRRIIESLATNLGRLFHNSTEEVLAAIDAVLRALDHPVIESARGGTALFRETPLVYRSSEGRLIEGIPDLVFRARGDEAWHVVDFKTDLRLDLFADAHRSQVALYMKAVADVMGGEIRGSLLYV